MVIAPSEQLLTDLRTLTAIVLAAGQSTRLPNENKLLKQLNGRPLIIHTVAAISTLGLYQPVIVTGYESDLVENTLTQFKLPCVKNLAPEQGSEQGSERGPERGPEQGPEQGMASSIRTGLSAIPNDAAGIFIVLGDMPLIQPEDYEALADAFFHAGGKAICVPTHAQKKGHPVLFPMRLAQALSKLEGDKGAKELLEKERNSLIKVPNASPRILMDFDNQADFDKH